VVVVVATGAVVVATGAVVVAVVVGKVVFGACGSFSSVFLAAWALYAPWIAAENACDLISESRAAFSA
jgi:hypothetical protein